MILTRSWHNLRKAFSVVTFLGCALCAFHFPLLAASSDYPVFDAQIPNPNDYSLFANSGYDGNWYVGYDKVWIKKLPVVPGGSYARAYLGAKLGRMKILPSVARPPEFNPIPGEIWIAIASTPVWTAPQRFKLTSTEDIPLEAGDYPLDNTGECEWYWTEIPISSINMAGDNYVALWSPTPGLVSISSAPILAAGWGNKEMNTWLASTTHGELPTDPKVSLASGVSPSCSRLLRLN